MRGGGREPGGGYREEAADEGAGPYAYGPGGAGGNEEDAGGNGEDAGGGNGPDAGANGSGEKFWNIRVTKNKSESSGDLSI